MSGMCTLYGELLLQLASNVHRCHQIIMYHGGRHFSSSRLRNNADVPPAHYWELHSARLHPQPLAANPTKRTIDHGTGIKLDSFLLSRLM